MTNIPQELHRQRCLHGRINVSLISDKHTTHSELSSSSSRSSSASSGTPTSPDTNYITDELVFDHDSPMYR